MTIRVIIVVLVVIAGGACSDSLSKVDVTRGNIKSLMCCLDMYKQSAGRYPSGSEGLAVVPRAVNCPYSLRDPWGRPYVYRYSGVANDEPTIFSVGPDGKEGSDDDVVLR